MIFSSFQYIIFFIIVLLLINFSRNNNVKKALLLMSSYVFYAYWDYRFLLLIIFSSITNYYIGKKIENSEILSYKKKWLISGIIVNLAVLGFFKYLNFFIGSANFLLNKIGTGFPLLNIILPIAISFITFEVMSYIIDIYRGHNKSAKTFWDLALLVAFFPHLIAGPILKPMQFLPQFDKDIKIELKNVEYGVQIFIFGLIKKVLIADRLAVFVDSVFKFPHSFSAVTLWLAVIAYSIQIFCDFSGYSDMAIGSAKCLGFEIPRNFNMPYISTSISEFWRRWHISLSTWLKEYLNFSLGGNKNGKVRQYINLFTVMLLGGLWHGASWNFVIWGGLHGIGLAVHKFYSKFINTETEPLILKGFYWLLTYVFVCFCWVFFRAKDFPTSFYFIEKMFCLTDPTGIHWFMTSLIVFIPFIILAHYIGQKLNKYPYLQLTSFRGLFVLFFVLLGLLFFKPTESAPFIYFQF